MNSPSVGFVAKITTNPENNTSQVRIAGTENTAQYWTNLGSQKSVNVTGLTSAIKSAQQWPIKEPKVGIILANQVESQKARLRPCNSPMEGRKSVLLRQTVLEVEKPESVPAMTLYWVESRIYSGKPVWKSKTQSQAQ